MKIHFGFLAALLLTGTLWAQQSKIITQNQKIFNKELSEIAEKYNSQLTTFAEEYVLDLRQLAITLKKEDPKGAKNAKKEAARFRLAADCLPNSTIWAFRPNS